MGILTIIISVDKSKTLFGISNFIVALKDKHMCNEKLQPLCPYLSFCFARVSLLEIRFIMRFPLKNFFVCQHDAEIILENEAKYLKSYHGCDLSYIGSHSSACCHLST